MHRNEHASRPKLFALIALGMFIYSFGISYSFYIDHRQDERVTEQEYQNCIDHLASIKLALHETLVNVQQFSQDKRAFQQIINSNDNRMEQVLNPGLCEEP